MTPADRSGTCLVCGVAVREHRRRSAAHVVFWHPDAHDAPCGAPCIGGGSRHSALGVESTHRTTECGVAGCDGGVIVGGAR